MSVRRASFATLTLIALLGPCAQATVLFLDLHVPVVSDAPGDVSWNQIYDGGRRDSVDILNVWAVAHPNQTLEISLEVVETESLGGPRPNEKQYCSVTTSGYIGEDPVGQLILGVVHDGNTGESKPEASWLADDEFFIPNLNYTFSITEGTPGNFTWLLGADSFVWRIESLRDFQGRCNISALEEQVMAESATGARTTWGRDDANGDGSRLDIAARPAPADPEEDAMSEIASPTTTVEAPRRDTPAIGVGLAAFAVSVVLAVKANGRNRQGK